MIVSDASDCDCEHGVLALADDQEVSRGKSEEEVPECEAGFLQILWDGCSGRGVCDGDAEAVVARVGAAGLVSDGGGEGFAAEDSYIVCYAEEAARGGCFYVIAEGGDGEADDAVGIYSANAGSYDGMIVDAFPNDLSGVVNEAACEINA